MNAAAALATALATALAAVLAAGARAQELREVVRLHENGGIAERYSVDAQERKQGRYESFHPDGKPWVTARFADGRRHGAWRELDAAGKKVRSASYVRDVLHGHDEQFHAGGALAAAGDWRDGRRHGKWTFAVADGGRKKTCEYRADALHGAVVIEERGAVVSRQKWADGEPVELDGFAFPVRERDLRALLERILAEPASEPDRTRPHRPAPKGAKEEAPDPLARERAAALRRLMAYRALCRLSYEEMTLDPEWNRACDAAAEICRRNGGLSHTPARPPGLDDARWELGRRGCSSSNLSGGGDLAGSVDGYMDDSDPSNLEHVGHRRWCLNPPMRKTGFGADGGYSAMWAFDASGSAPKGVAAVHYPPEGWCPADFFGDRHAFSVQLLRGGAPDAANLAIAVRALDDDWVPVGEPLALDHCGVAPGDSGCPQCLVFRAAGFDASPGRRYVVHVAERGVRAPLFHYVVAFCAPVAAPR